MIIAENLTKKYPTRTGPPHWVLRDVSFTIPPCTGVGIIGQNGAGKSTLLRIIAGNDYPTSGTVRREVRVSWPVGFGGGLQGSLTGRQNAKFVCRIQGREDDAEEVMQKMQDFAEIGTAFDEPVKTYSSGMRARLQFAMSLAFEFDVYISDEITAVGDANFRKKALTHFQSLVGKAGLIMVSHNENTLKEYCQAGLLLHEGHAYWYDEIGDAIAAYAEKMAE